MIPFILLIIGLVLILLEFYLPGAIMGILGSLFILSSVILFASKNTSPISIIFFMMGTTVSVVLLIRYILWRIVHTKPEYSIYSDANQQGFQASHYDKSLIGKKGIVISDLKPGGYVLIDGKQYQAISIAGYISKGEEIIVLSGQEESLMVNLSKRNLNHE